MKVDIVSIKDFQFEKVCFYTVLLQKRRRTEFEDFSFRMCHSTEINKVDYGEIVKFINRIGESENGATVDNFKDEKSAHRLKIVEIEKPTKGQPNNYGLRLYCYRINEKVVILFNGDRKTKDKAQQCPKCRRFFETANLIARELENAMALDKISTEDTYIDIEENFILNI